MRGAPSGSHPVTPSAFVWCVVRQGSGQPHDGGDQMNQGARSGAWLLAAASILVTTGCGGGAPTSGAVAASGVLDGSAFVAVPRDLGTSAASQLRTGQLRALASSQLAAGESF